MMRPEVGHRGRHDEHVSAAQRLQHRRAHRLRCLGSHDLGPLRERHAHRPGDEGHVRPARDGRLGDGDAHPPARAVADEAHRVDRLRGPARRHDQPAPGQVGSADGLVHGRPRRHPGGADGATGQRGDDRVKHGLGRRQAPDTALPRGERTRLGRHDRVAVAAQSLEVGLRRGVAVHLAVHGRGDHDRGRGSKARGRDDVVGKTRRHGRDPASRGRCDDDRVGRVGHHDVPDATVREQLERVAHDPAAGEGLEGERADELAAGTGEEDL